MKIEANFVIKQNMYEPRPKRGLIAMGKIAMAVVPHLIYTSALKYQGSQLNKLDNEIKALKSQILMISALT